MNEKAKLALHAVELRNKYNCGRWAISRYVKKHGIGSLYRLALQLSATSVIE